VCGGRFDREKRDEERQNGYERKWKTRAGPLLSYTAEESGEACKGKKKREKRGDHTTYSRCMEVGNAGGLHLVELHRKESLPWAGSACRMHRNEQAYREGMWYTGKRMDHTKARAIADPIAAAQSARYPAGAEGILTSEGLRQACGHVWRDSNSIIMLGADILNSEPVSYDDKQALMALRRHIAAVGPRAFVEDVLPKLGFGPGRD
jgi:hypothetical protein